MSKSMIMSKMKIKDILKQTNENITVAIPKFENDKEVFNKIKGDFKAKVWEPRNLKHHNKFFKILEIAVENGAYEKLSITEEVYHALLRQNGNKKTEALRYYLKYMYLPCEIHYLPTGKKQERVNSIAFDKMDQITFTEFYNDCLNCIADALEIDREVLENNIGA